MRLGNRVRLLREQHGESLDDLSRAVGIDRSQLSKLERQLVGCSDRLKLAIAAHYGVSITEVFFVVEGVDTESTLTADDASEHHLADLLV